MEKIKTNRLLISLNLREIISDFSVFRLKTSDKYIPHGSMILDETLGELKAISVVFENGNSFYSLFNNPNIIPNEIGRSIKHLKGGEKISIEKLDSVNKLETVPQNILAQLLLNSATSLQNKNLAYNNLTGYLLCLNKDLFVISKNEDKAILKIPALKISIDHRNCLKLEVKTFTNLLLRGNLKPGKPLKEYPKYTISYANMKLRRILNHENLSAKDTYVNLQESNKKSTIPFFSLESPEKFLQSKMGFLYNFISEINEKLSTYILLEFHEILPNESLRYEKRLTLEKNNAIQALLRKSKIHFVDGIADDDSAEYLNELKLVMKQIYPEISFTQSNRFKMGCMNVQLIHNEDFYSRFELDDPYEKKHSGYLVQHLTFEDFKYSSEAAIKNIVKELCIKLDIQNRQISLIDWGKFNHSGSWRFGLKQDDMFYFLEVTSNGGLIFTNFENNLFTQNEFSTYLHIYNEYDGDGEINAIEGIIISPQNDINIIQRTSLYTLPNFFGIGRVFDEVIKTLEIEKEMLIDLLNEFFTMNNHEKSIEIISKVMAWPNKVLNRKDIISIITHKTIKKGFTQFLYGKTGQLLHYYFKDELTRYKLLDSNLDVKYYIKNDCGYYFVGTKGDGIQSNFPRASVIRQISAHDDSKILFNELLPTLNVDFVKNGDITVIPFPFKYLREYVNKDSKHKITSSQL